MMAKWRFVFLCLLWGALVVSCSDGNAFSSGEGETADLSLGAGFRYSTYGPPYDPGPAYWAEVGRQMAARFPHAVPQTIWIVSTISGRGSYLNFPGSSDDNLLYFSLEDDNEAALTLFDGMGMQVWLQVEPGDASVGELIHATLKRYSHHPSVIGVGVDVEWYQSRNGPEGTAVTDQEAEAWVDIVRSYNSDYRLFLKHWLPEKMPPTVRDGLVFVDDSQQFSSLADMVMAFSEWGKIFAPSPVAFQFGYESDKGWWKDFADPPKEIGDQILAAIPNTVGLYWVDFTVLELFPPNTSGL